VFTLTVTSGGVSETANVNVTVTALTTHRSTPCPARRAPTDTAQAITGVSVMTEPAQAVTTIISDNGVVNVTAGGRLRSPTTAATRHAQIRRTAAEINAALLGQAYTDTADYNGPSHLTVAANDGTRDRHRFTSGYR
jgi:hypothetical protein